MADKYMEIFEQTLDNIEGDGMERFKAATSAMRDALLNDVPVWMKFNMISWMISGKPDESIIWDKVNEMLKPNKDYMEYDFNAFEYIDSKQKFFEAAADSKISTIFNQPYVKRVCKDCGKTYTLTFGQVKFYCKKKWPIPKKCPKCLQIKNGIKSESAVVKKDKLYTPGFITPLNDMAEALRKAGLNIQENI